MNNLSLQNDLVSVIMPVYNADKYVDKAIRSILNQTYTNFEFIIIDDGSTDKSLHMINTFNDNRIKLHVFNTHRCIVDALNFGLQQAKGTYIARMDADDTALPERFAKQVNFMQQNPLIGLCGSWFKLSTGKVIKAVQTHQQIKYRLINASAFAHSAVMFRANIIQCLLPKPYQQQFEFTEDLDLWMRLVNTTQMANVPEVLLHVTVNQGTHVKHLETSSTHNIQLKTQYLGELFNELTQEDYTFLAKHLNRIIPIKTNKQEFTTFLTLLNKIYDKHATPELVTELNAAVWFKLASNAPQSFWWINDSLKYKFVQLSVWQMGWLLLKPVVGKFKN